jgi:hypothetical protein
MFAVVIDQRSQRISISLDALGELRRSLISVRRTFEFAQIELTPADLGGTMTGASTSLGEASARI